MESVRIVGFDPALANWGAAIAEYDIETGDLNLVEIGLEKTKKTKKRTKGLDIYERSRQLNRFVRKFADRGDFVFSELPVGSQSASAAWGLSAAVATLASISKPVEFVTVKQVKEVVGLDMPEKAEMIAWAMNNYPDADWHMRKYKGEMVPMNDNEHMADAVAVIHAGLQTKAWDSFIASLQVSQR